MRGAGGTQGGLGHFFIGLLMMCGGFYLLFNAITVTSNFGMGMRLYSLPAFGSRYGVTTGMVLIPFIIGIGLVFYNGRSVIGWILSVGSITALIFGVIASIQLNLRTMTAFELITILVLSIGVTGLFFRSFKAFDDDPRE